MEVFLVFPFLILTVSLVCVLISTFSSLSYGEKNKRMEKKKFFDFFLLAKNNNLHDFFLFKNFLILWLLLLLTFSSSRVVTQRNYRISLFYYSLNTFGIMKNFSLSSL